MASSSDLLRGHIDMLILAKLAQGDCYGYRVNRDIQALAGQRFDLKEATLYSAFRRLEKDGLIRSYWGDEETGARRRYYSITGTGKADFAQLRESWEDMKKSIDALLRGKEDSDD